MSRRLRLVLNLGALVLAMIFGGVVTALLLPAVRAPGPAAPPAVEKPGSTEGPLADRPKGEGENPPPAEAEAEVPPPADAEMPSLAKKAEADAVRTVHVDSKATQGTEEPTPAAGDPAARPAEKTALQAQEPKPQVVLKNRGLKAVGQLFLLEDEEGIKPKLLELDQIHAEWTRLVARMSELEGLAAKQQKYLASLQNHQQNLMNQYMGLSAIPPGAGLDTKQEGGQGQGQGETDRDRQARELAERRNREAELARQTAARNERRQQLEFEFSQVQSQVNEQEYGILMLSNEYNRLYGTAMEKENEFQAREGDLNLMVDSIRERYAELADDTEVRLALKQLNKDGVQYALGPQENFKANLEKMKRGQMEEKGLRKRKSSELFVLTENADVKTLEFRTRTIDEQLVKAQGKAAEWRKAAAYRTKLLGETLRKVSPLEAQLAGASPDPAKSRAAADLKGAQSRIATLRKEQAEAEKSRQAIFEAVTTSRDAYVRSIAALRKAVDAAKEKHQNLKNDPQVKGVKIEPISQAALESLKKAEATIATEEIPLESDKTVFRVDAAINGQARKMVIDRAVDLVRISESEAATLGIIPLEADPTVELDLGNGQTLPARRTQIKSLQVGSFAVSDVACLVILKGYEARPVLGTDFLGNFASKLDPESGKLTLTQVKLKPATTTEKRSRQGK